MHSLDFPHLVEDLLEFCTGVNEFFFRKVKWCMREDVGFFLYPVGAYHIIERKDVRSPEQTAAVIIDAGEG
jgi:hypothetical protein